MCCTVVLSDCKSSVCINGKFYFITGLNHSLGNFTNMSDFAAMNEVYGRYFDAETAPARSTIEVARLPKDVLVEIETVAHT